ncbi:MFS transporter [Gluconobacter japonicus]|uniref:MFS transporter n=1 Tax=Gluconobacter japonicus TaxID=376620 RepID=UPI00029AC511|nr:MFS transporter [Gluconobacter japonicus]KXV25753.1 MFS transporter [Gluconobacter japonicus]MDI6653642.1 MFS transporter [Gluconobacter japonicus]GAP24112.1 transporter [Gluconobacter frateurii NBRC 101659]
MIDPALRALPGLRPLIISRICSQLSATTMTIAIGWQIYALTHSVASLGYLGLAQFLPMVPLTFISGHVADRFNRRNIVLTCQILEILSTGALAAAAAMQILTPALVYTFAAFYGTLRSFEMPCQQAFLPAIAPPELLPRAQALLSSLFMTASIVGPSLGGLLYGLGAVTCYSLATLGFALAFFGTLALRLHHTVPAKEPVTFASVFAGLGFLNRRRDLLGAISLDLFAVLLGGATALLPVYADSVLHVGPIGLGFLRAAPAIGALVTSVWLSRHPLGRRAGVTMFISVVVFGVATIVFGASHITWISVLALMILGAADVISVVIRSSLIQLATPDSMRGRVSAVNSLFIGSSNQLGEFESGTLGAAIGPEAAVIAGGVGTILVALVWIRLFPKLWSLDRLEDVRPEIL